MSGNGHGSRDQLAWCSVCMPTALAIYWLAYFYFMKTLLATIFFVTALFVVGVQGALAQSAFDPGGMYNPLYIQVQQDPLQKLQQQMQQASVIENNLKSTYGLSNYYSCSSDRASRDLSAPGAMTDYMNSVKYCLELKSITESNTQRDTQNLEQSCKNDLGVYGKLGNVDLVNRKYSCVCQAGYNLNSSATACVVSAGVNNGVSSDWSTVMKQASSLLQAPKECQDSYGPNSNWDGVTKYKDGAPVCGCKSGYSLNDQRTSCVASAESIAYTEALIEKKKKEAVPLNEHVKNVSEPKTTKQETKVKKSVQSQVITPASHTQEASVVGALPDTQTVKSKSLWATIRGWFGF